MTRLLVFLAALILYLAPPAAQAFAASHVRPPGAALVQPSSADTESTPIPEPVGYWTRIFDSVANDPQAVATIFAAFLGFLFGVLIKYRLDRRADRFRRETDRRILASALRAELLSLDVACLTRITAFEKLLKEAPQNKVFGGPHSFAPMALPPRRVWMAHLGRIGELEGFDPDILELVHSAFDSYDIDVEAFRQQAGAQGVGRKILQGTVDRLKKLREAIAKAGGPLFEQIKVDQSWWRRVLDF